jgi:outer membrane protein assembly factor BamB
MIPCAEGKRVFVGTQAGFLLALDLDSGAEIWRIANDGIFGFANPVAARGLVLVADRGNRGRAQRDDQTSGVRGSTVDTSTPRGAFMHAYDAKTGAERWRMELRATGCSTPGIGRTFAVAGFRDVVARFDIMTGQFGLWKWVPTGRNAFGSPTMVGDELVYGNLDGHLYVYDCSAERMSWSFHVPGAQVAEFVHTGDRIYVSTTNGLYALGDDPSAHELQPGFVLEAQ